MLIMYQTLSKYWEHSSEQIQINSLFWEVYILESEERQTFKKNKENINYIMDQIVISAMEKNESEEGNRECYG